MKKSGSNFKGWFISIGIIIALIYICPSCESSSKITNRGPAPSFITIRNNMKNMTDLQWKSYRESLIGKTLSGGGWISDVDSQSGGKYKVFIDMDKPGTLSVQDIYIEDVPKNLAYDLMKDESVYFSGKITSIMNLLGSCAITIEYEEIY